MHGSVDEQPTWSKPIVGSHVAWQETLVAGSHNPLLGPSVAQQM